MTIDELLARLNSRASSSTGRAVTARMLEDWVYEDLIPGPSRHGGTPKPNWQWSEKSLIGALKVIEYRERGFERNDGIRAQWWLEGREFKFHLILDCLVNEFDRSRKSLLRNVSSTHGLRRDGARSEYRRRALLGQLGQLDPLFAEARIDLGEALTLLFYELARLREQITPFDIGKEQLATLVANAVLPNGAHIFAGLLDDEEASPRYSAYAIRNLAPDQLQQCRASASILPFGLALAASIIPALTADPGQRNKIEAAFSATLNSVHRWPWMIFWFGVVANIMYNSKLTEAE